MDTKKRWIAVFAGSAEGSHPEFVQAARILGEWIARRGHGLLYGGSALGLMSAVAAGSASLGGRVWGVIPRALASAEAVGLPHQDGGEYAFGPGDIEVVESMHQRQARIHKLADAYVALPGGLGTLSELFEALTWAGLGLHSKPIGLLNTASYYDPVIRLLAHCQKNGFVPDSGQLLIHDKSASVLIDRLLTHTAPAAKRNFDWQQNTEERGT